MDPRTERLVSARPQPFHFLPVPGFSMIGLMAAMEPLQVANRYHEDLFRWHFLSIDGRPVTASNGIPFDCESSIEQCGQLSTLILCAGFHPERVCTESFLTWLRVRASEGTILGGVDTGSIILAKAGLLRGYRATVHWQHLASFQEDFRDVIVTGNLFEIDRNRFTSSGGTSSLDMMLRLITQNYGHDLAVQISDALIHERIRDAHEDQRMEIGLRLQSYNPRLNRLIKLMEDNLEQPLSIKTIAERTSLSSRQVHRLFQTYLEKSPGRFYLGLRLEKARQLLRQTSLPIMDVALACGFASNASLTKSYTAFFGHSPRHERQGRTQARA